MSWPTASLVRSTVDSETRRPASFLSTTSAASPKLSTAPAMQTSSLRPGRQRLPRQAEGLVPGDRARATATGSGNRPDPGGRSPPGSGPSWADSRRTGPIRGSAGSSCWTLGTPFFPLVQSGLEGLGADLVDAVADLELGLPQELAIGLGGEQVGEAAEVGVGGLAERLDRSGRTVRPARGSRGDRDMGALRERMTTKSEATHRRALLYEIFHPQSRRLPPEPVVEVKTVDFSAGYSAMAVGVAKVVGAWQRPASSCWWSRSWRRWPPRRPAGGG